MVCRIEPFELEWRSLCPVFWPIWNSHAARISNCGAAVAIRGLASVGRMNSCAFPAERGGAHIGVRLVDHRDALKTLHDITLLKGEFLVPDDYVPDDRSSQNLFEMLAQAGSEDRSGSVSLTCLRGESTSL